MSKAAGLHAWNLAPAQAVELQRRLAAQVVCEDALGPVRYVAGVDVGFEAGNTVTRAAVVVLDFPALIVADQAVARRPTAFPYIPGLLSFRELPAVLDAFARLTLHPDLILCDGQGLAHPRRFGLACHLGVWLDMPAIGVAKSRLIGTHEDVPVEKGAQRPLIDRGECIGTVLRTRAGVQPLYVSVGHRISLPTAVDYVLRCTPRYRLPETTRAAHKLASKT